MRWQALFALSLVLCVSISQAADVDRSRVRVKHRATRAQTEAQLERLAKTAVELEKAQAGKIDPRRYDVTFENPFPSQEPTAYFSFMMGKSYSYRFISKAAHMDTFLPNADKVNPQTPLEAFGLFPFAVLEGTLLIEPACMTSDRRMLLRASLKDIRAECVNEPGYNNNCDTLDQLASNLTTYPFWFTHNANGEIITMDFNKYDSLEMMGIKQNLVRDISLTVAKNGETREVFARYYQSANSTVGTRYRVRPFTRHAHDDNRIEGVVVRKDRASKRPSVGPRLPTDPAFQIERHSWVFMIIGGDIAPSNGPSPVPTFISVLEETQLDPAKLRFIQPNNTANVFVLSHLDVTLRSISKGVDNTSNLLINGTCGISELDVADDVIFRPNPPLALLEIEATETELLGDMIPAMPTTPLFRAASASSSSVHRDVTELDLESAKQWYEL